MPFGEAFPALGRIGVIHIILPQRLAHRVPIACTRGEGHDGVVFAAYAAYAAAAGGVHRAAHGRVDVVDGRVAGVRGGMGDGDLTGLLERLQPLLRAVFASGRVGGGGARVFEGKVFVALDIGG